MNENFMVFTFFHSVTFLQTHLSLLSKRQLSIWKPLTLSPVTADVQEVIPVFMGNASFQSFLGVHRFFLFRIGNGALLDASETLAM